MTIPSSDTQVRPELICPEPDERPDLWPYTARRGDDGVLEIGGVKLDAVANTPAYIWDVADFSARAQVWKAAMEEAFWPGYGLAGANVYYAAKAFLSAKAVQLATAAGLGIDTASEGELTCALRAGADPKLLGLHGNNKSSAAIELALKAGIGRIIIDSVDEISRLEKIARGGRYRDVPVMIRLTTGVHAGGHEFISTGHEDQKFGLSLDGDAQAAVAAIKTSEVLTLSGLHSHIGSQIFTTEGFTEAVRTVIGFAAQCHRNGVEIGEIDCGGGLAIAYTGTDQVAPSPKQLADALAEAVVSCCKAENIPVPRVSVEPGRSIAGPSQVMVYRVGTVKTQPLAAGSRTYVSVDGGMSDNIRPALYGANYTATLANRVSSADLVRARVVGSHCESGDIVIHDVCLPADISDTDLLVVPAVGAYGQSMASTYNMFPRAGVYAAADGKLTVSIAAETVADVLARDCDLNR